MIYGGFLRFQVFVLLIIFILFFMFTTNITYVRLGLYDLYFKKFRILLLASAFIFAVTLAAKLHQMVLLYNLEVTQPQLWERRGFYEVFLIQRILMIIYLCILMYSTRVALQPKLYTDECITKL
eukprot:TRINITY_DN9973_c0_g1_i3.p2 TRINITY_DN9973_c0_g1~~TRINITY_DN9973_c0_g1_i3.p2  ORF type:complete len:124 (-),score=3.33 TRINITY_DN9973_c0_g1_i3:261-632(-)